MDDEVIEFANKEMNNVVMSIDGRKEVHDRLRKNYAGQAATTPSCPSSRSSPARGNKEYYVRGTFTHNNVDFTNDIFHLADLGFDQLSMEPVVCAPGDPYALTEEDLPKIMEQYEILAKEMLRRESRARASPSTTT